MSKTELKYAMRWVLVCLGSLAAGGLAILLSLCLLFLWLLATRTYIGPGGWSLSGRHWQLEIFGLTVFIFGIGCSAGFWFFNKRFHQ